MVMDNFLNTNFYNLYLESADIKINDSCKIFTKLTLFHHITVLSFRNFVKFALKSPHKCPPNASPTFAPV